MTFKIIAKDKKTNARVAVLSTKSGDIQTPFFMPVATKTAVKHISVEDLESMGAKAIISNAFILSLRPGTKIIKKFSGIKKFMNYSGINFTDSGGFQMYSPTLYLSSNDKGVFFRDPFAGKKFFVTPEKDMEIQLDIGSDVAMCLDSMPLIEHSKEAIAEAVRKTTLWAKRCKKHHYKLQKSLSKDKRQLLFGITQGGIHSDLRKKSTQELAKIDFDGFSIGGLALGEPKKDEYKMIEICKKILPENKPIYLMGAGDPVELLESISRGVDIFDSRFPTKNARRGAIFTSNGRLRLMQAKNKLSKRPLDEKCSCFVCKDYSRAHIRHLLQNKEGVGYRLASYHNLYFLQNLLNQARQAIKEGKFKKFLNDFKKNYKN
jgi:queuine tRNA-ribosyltransferase